VTLRDRVRKSGSYAAGFVNLWASLLALGLAPSVATVIAVVVGLVTGALGQALLIALALSLVVNLVLLVLAIRARSYAKALESDMELIGNLMRERREPAPPWLPDKDGRMPIANADLERTFEDALALARTLGADAQLGVGWIDLSRPQVSFNGFSQSGRKRFRIWCDPRGGCSIVQLERSEASRYPTDEPQWRADSTWQELIRKAAAREEPFRGNVMLWPRRDGNGETRVGGLWRIEFRRTTDGVIDQPTSYILVDHELHEGR
jgi:hypothetical protein